MNPTLPYIDNPRQTCADARNPYTATNLTTTIEELLLFQKLNIAEELLDTRLRLDGCYFNRYFNPWQ